MNVCRLTTEDNPYDPFDQYDDWYAYDERSGYYTPSYLARITITSDDLSVADYNLAIEQAIDEIIEENPTLPYKKVTRVID